MTCDSPKMQPLRRPPTTEELAAATTSVAPLSKAVAKARQAAGPGAQVVAWISDLHIQAPRPYDELMPIYTTDVDTTANAALAFAELAALQPAPDLLVLGGDLADSGMIGEAPADEYAEIARVLDAHLPPGLRSLAITGNHDHADQDLSAAWHTAFTAIRRPDWPLPVEAADVYFETVLGDWRVLALDLRQAQPLAERQYQWLTARLAGQDDRPIMILVHRPLVCSFQMAEDDELADHRTYALLRAHPAVKLVCSGHTHRAVAGALGDIWHVCFPGVATGMPDPVGWGVVVLGADRPHAIFVKEMAIDRYYDFWRDSMQHQVSAVRDLTPK